MVESIPSEIATGIVSGAQAVLPSDVTAKISFLADISKIAVGIIIAYFLLRIIFLLLRARYERKNHKLLKKISHTLESIKKSLSSKK